MAKRWMEEIESRGYDEIPNKFVCPNCIHEDAVKEFVKNNLYYDTCSYCGTTSQSPIAASVESVAELVVQSISSEWLMPEDAGIPYESKEGGWLVEPTRIEDVLEEEGFYADEPIFGDIVGAINQEYWAKEFAMPLPELDILYYWESFCKEVKHTSRYVFFRMIARELYSFATKNNESSCGILDAVADYCDELDMIKTIPAGHILYRARIHDHDTYSTVKELGPPPALLAKYSNRMSPAGIAMFYGADDTQTAIKEAAAGQNRDGIASVGQFEILSDIKVLDLTSLPNVPSIFDKENRHHRTIVLFMQGFLSDFQKEIVKDGREHIEYVPTQIVTEFFRFIFRPEGSSISGIKYESAQNENGICYVLFAEQADCIENKDRAPDALVEYLLTLDTTSVETIRLGSQLSAGGKLLIGAAVAGAVAGAGYLVKKHFEGMVKETD